jgi:hypothetical protein
MMRTVGAVLAVLLVAVPAAAQQIHVDYDRWARFSAFRTIAWAPTEETSMLDTSPPMHERIRDMIMAEVTAGRLTIDNEDPDLYITYHTAEKEALQVNTHHWGYGYPSNWYWDPHWGAAVSTTTVRTYTQGTFIIDIWDAREKTIVWRGTAVATVSENPEKNLKRMQKAVRKMAKKWNKMKPGF